MKPLIALCMIVRNDALSLARALRSAREHVDEIDIGIDDRTTDPDTRKVAETFTSSVWTFGHTDVGLSAEQWQAGFIHFSNARNMGLARVKSPWIMVIDSDEYLDCSLDLRALASRYLFTKYNSFSVRQVSPTFEHVDPTRITRAHLRWQSPTHNQLPGVHPALPIDVRVVEDKSLRFAEENKRRNVQRDAGIELLRPLAEQGDQHALYHLAKHYSATEEGPKFAQKYLDQTQAHGEFADARAMLCVLMAQQLHRQSKNLEAGVWAVKALFDGPHEDAFVLLSVLAEARKDEKAAETWAKAANLTPSRGWKSK